MSQNQLWGTNHLDTCLRWMIADLHALVWQCHYQGSNLGTCQCNYHLAIWDECSPVCLSLSDNATTRASNMYLSMALTTWLSEMNAHRSVCPCLIIPPPGLRTWVPIYDNYHLAIWDECSPVCLSLSDNATTRASNLGTCLWQLPLGYLRWLYTGLYALVWWCHHQGFEPVPVYGTNHFAIWDECSLVCMPLSDNATTRVQTWLVMTPSTLKCSTLPSCFS